MLTLCLEHFNERIGGHVTEKDVIFHEAVCEECQERKPCVLVYNPSDLPYYTLDAPVANT